MRQQEEEELEATSRPMRGYLMEQVVPTLSQGLTACCRAQPQDPVDFLVFHCPQIIAWSLASPPRGVNRDGVHLFVFQAEYLLKNNPFEADCEQLS